MSTSGGASNNLGPRSWWPCLLPPLLVGAALRLYRLGPQILTGDELHVVNAIRHWSVSEIVTRWTYQGADYSVPLAAFFRFILDSGVTLGETSFRLPSLVAGLAALIAVPAMLQPRIGRRPALWLAWLLALSPPLVFYSRIARSYAPVVLLSVCAVLAFERWWRSSHRGAAAAYVLCSGLAVYFHLGAAPIVSMPLIWAGIETWLVSRRESTPLRSSVPQLVPIAWVGSLTAVFTAALLLPARGSLLELASLHSRGGTPTLAGWGEALRLTLGTPSWLATGLAITVASRGGWLLWNRDPSLARLFALVGVGHVAGLVLLAPNYFEAPQVVSRYVLVLLPFAFTWVALGLSEPIARFTQSPRATRVQMAIASVLVLASFLSGPLTRPELRRTSFAHSGPFLLYTRPLKIPPIDALPRFYRELEGAKRGVLLEMPWMNLATSAYRTYQLQHGLELRMGLAAPELEDPRFALRNFIAPELETILASDARWLVVHADIRAEELELPIRDEHQAAMLRASHSHWTVLSQGARRLAREAESAWGPAPYADDRLQAWDLDALRR